MKQLTYKQQKYCRERAKGKSYAEAYKAAGYSPGSNMNTMRQNAFTMENKSAKAEMIRERILELMEREEKGAILNRQARQALLTEIALEHGEDTQNKLRAIDQLNRMSGDYTDRAIVEHQGAVSMTYEERLAAIREGLNAE